MGSYSTYRLGRKVALVRDEWHAELADVFLYGKGCEPAGKAGRGKVFQFDFPGGEGILRRCRRGGIIRHVVKDSFLFSNRPFHELKVHDYLYDNGFATPEPLGISWEREWLWFRGSIATRRVEAKDLLTFLDQSGDSAEYTLEWTGRIIREMHNLGVYHADLQVRNILVAPEHPYIIDFDKAQRMPKVSTLQRMRNLLRLKRSFEKNFLPMRFFEKVVRGYGVEKLPRMLERLYATKGVVSDAMSSRADSE